MSEKITALLKEYTPPANWKGGHIFLMPEAAMNYIHQFILDHQLVDCIELGTGFGATSCMIVDALEQLGNGKLVTLDKYYHQPVNVDVLLQYVGYGNTNKIEVIADELGYNWYLPELILKQTQDDYCTPLFDFCLLDGAHEWEVDALAFFLVAKLIKPGGWIAIDDINYYFRMMPDWEKFHAHRTRRELDTLQMEMVYEIAVKQHPDFEEFHLTHDGRVGWARKKKQTTAPSKLKKFFKNVFNR